MTANPDPNSLAKKHLAEFLFSVILTTVADLGTILRRFAARFVAGIGSAIGTRKANPFLQQIEIVGRENEALRRETVSAKKAQEIAEAFVGIVEHDLKEPLRLINIFIPLIKDSVALHSEPELRKFCDFVMQGGRRIESLTHRCLLHLRAAGAADEELTDLNETVINVIEVLRPSVLDCGAEIVVGDLPIACGNSAWFDITFRNLLENAIKFRRQDLPLRIRIQSRSYAPGWEAISIDDNGIGIAPDVVSSIFERFKRGTNVVSGEGLGLYNTAFAISRVGGTVWAENNPVGGARFCFTVRGAGDHAEGDLA